MHDDKKVCIALRYINNTVEETKLGNTAWHHINRFKSTEMIFHENIKRYGKFCVAVYIWVSIENEEQKNLQNVEMVFFRQVFNC